MGMAAAAGDPPSDPVGIARIRFQIQELAAMEIYLRDEIARVDTPENRAAHAAFQDAKAEESRVSAELTRMKQTNAPGADEAIKELLDKQLRLLNLARISHRQIKDARKSCAIVLLSRQIRHKQRRFGR